ncbi:hypothetical protein NMG60_11031018 [Bertholletia excelsa]
MSDFTREYEEDDELQFQGSLAVQSSNGSPNNPAENGGSSSTPASTISKKKRNLPGNPDPDAEVVALSPRTLMATNRYICEVCHKGFQRDQNLQLHRRGHNLPWKLKQRPTTQVKKRVYICPEPSCVHHDPSRALGDLTGIKKHFCRKHGEKKWKCDKCSKRYAVQSDWKAHSKICGTREYRCDCGTIFSRKDSFVTHRAFCDALTEENYKLNQTLAATGGMLQSQGQDLFSSCSVPASDSCMNSNTNTVMNLSISHHDNADQLNPLKPLSFNSHGHGTLLSGDLNPIFNPATARACFNSAGGLGNSSLAVGSAYTSATALLQKAAEMGAKISDNSMAPILLRGFSGYSSSGTGINSSGSAQEASSAATANNGLYIANNSEAFDKSVTPAGLYNTSPLMQQSTGNSSAGNLLERQAILQESEKMTLDFLGVEPAAHSGYAKKRSCDGNLTRGMGIGYSNPQAQQSLHNLQSEW